MLRRYSLQQRRGFTLLELLIVIAMLAILAVVVILVLNPAETLRRARDSQRLSDLSTLKSAISIYLTTANSPDLDGDGSRGDCGTNLWLARGNATDITDTKIGGRTLHASGDSESAAVNGTGWIPVDFTQTPGGSPIAALPKDPNYAVADPAHISSDDRLYLYTCNTNNTFELTANMESANFASGGSADKEKSDGGDDLDMLEVGTNPTLMAGLSWDIRLASYDTVNFSITAQDPIPDGLAFKTDGTKMYVMGYANDRVFQYSL